MARSGALGAHLQRGGGEQQQGGGDPEAVERLTEILKPEIIVSALPDRTFPARLKEAATQADPVTRTFPVRMNFENPDDVNVLPGMTAKVRVVLDPDLAASIPASAAQDDGAGKPYVWKIDPEAMTVSKVPVELGDVSGDSVTIVSGLSEGDQVAVSGVMALREGMKVRKYEP